MRNPNHVKSELCEIRIMRKAEEQTSMIRCAQEIRYADEIRYVGMRKRTEEKEEG